MMNLKMQLSTLRQAWLWKRLCLYAICYTAFCYGFKALDARHLSPLISRIVFQLISSFSVIAFSIWTGRIALKRANPAQP
jgi:hypothetical protein